MPENLFVLLLCHCTSILPYELKIRQKASSKEKDYLKRMKKFWKQ